jgi:hypothetical protein
MQGVPAHEITWLKRFFSGRNALHWDAVIDGSATPGWLEHVVPWIELFSQGKPYIPIVLPVFDEDGPSTWYAAASNENAAATLAEELSSVVGPSYSDFRGQRCQCSPVDGIEAALRDRFGHFIFRFSPQPDSARIDIVKALSLYLAILRRRPDTPDRTQQPFGKVRGDFDRALLAGNETAAAKLLEDLYATGRVNAEQQKFLEIRLLAGLGRQQELAHNDALIKAVMDLSLPPQTLTDLVDALYSRFVSSVENDTRFDVVASAFKQTIGKRFGALFKERKGVRQSNVLKAFLLYELTQETPNPTRCEAIVSTFPDDEGGKALVQRWSLQIKATDETRPSNLLQAARQAVADEDYEVAVDLYLKLLPEPHAYNGLLRCAVELSAVELTIKVLSLIDDATKDVQNGLSERDKKRIATLRTGSAPTAPVVAPTAGWVKWAEAVVANQYKTSAIAILDGAIQKWAVEDYFRDPAQCEKLALIIGNADGTAERVFRDAFPHLVEFFVDRPLRPVRGFVPLYCMLINIVAWNGTASADELELVTSLMYALVGIAPEKEIYTESLQALEEILAQNKASSITDWALNLAETLTIFPAPDIEARLRVFMTVVDLMKANSHRVSNPQRTMLQFLVKDYNCEQLLADFPSLESMSDLGDGRIAFSGLIGIYTLTEAAGQRAKQLLQKMLPEARVEFNGDFVATDRLKHLAAAADIFVFAWRSSKHQAYFCVKEARGSHPIEMPLGKGTASILQAALAAVRKYVD